MGRTVLYSKIDANLISFFIKICFPMIVIQESLWGIINPIWNFCSCLYLFACLCYSSFDHWMREIHLKSTIKKDGGWLSWFQPQKLLNLVSKYSIRLNKLDDVGYWHLNFPKK